MTIAVAVKVFEGMVLAADSATTIALTDPAGNAAGHHVYNNANKLFHLHRAEPVAAFTWGLGSVGAVSISTIAKALRKRLMGRDPAFLGWRLAAAYTMREIADRFVELVEGELISAAALPGGHLPAELGVLVAGYSDGQDLPEAWEIIFPASAAAASVTQAFAPDDVGWRAWAQPEATQRLFTGIDPHLLDELKSILSPGDFAAAFDLVQKKYNKWPIHPAMPFADAIETARFLATVTAGYSHLLLGPDTVGGPIDIAGINRHEGFKWIDRKYYFSRELNPGEVDYD